MTDWVIGVDLGGTKIRAGRVGGDGTVAEEQEVRTDTSSGDAILRQIADLVARLRASGGDVRGVGIGLPGTIDQGRGVLIQAVNLPLGDVPLRDRLGELIGLPVVIDNDANCAALGEHAHGAAGPYPHSIMLTLGTGVGGGLVFDGRLFRGATGAGGELGHIVIDLDGPRCQGSCPGRGHLESFCSGTALTRRAREHVAARPDGSLAAAVAPGEEADSRLVVRQAEAGDAEAQALLTEHGRILGAGLVGLANVFEPSVFVIGGGLGEAAGERLLVPAREVVAREALRPMDETPVVLAQLGGDAGMIGAAELLRI
jgi:glucokinase